MFGMLWDRESISDGHTTLRHDSNMKDEYMQVVYLVL